MNHNLPLIHIGYPKTGTKWFQRILFPNIKNIDFISHKNLPEYLIQEPTIENLKACQNYFTDIHKRIVISDERLVGSVKKNTIKSNPVKIKRIFNDAEIIIFIRNQIDKYASNYNQFIKRNGGTCFIDEFLFPEESDEIWGFEKHCYDKIIDIYKEIFPENRIHIFLYEEFKNNPKDFIIQFTKKFNLEVDLDRLSFKPINTSLSIYLLKIKRYLNHFTKDFYKKTHPSLENKKYYFHLPYWLTISYRIFRVLEKFEPEFLKSSPEKLLGARNIIKIKNAFKQSNQNLITKHGLDIIMKYNYPHQD